VGLLKAFTMVPHEGRIITPDETFSGTMLMMAIGNGRLAGGGYHVAPRAVLDDGLVDLVIVPDFDLVDLPEAGKLLSEMIRLETEEPQRVPYKQLPSFEIQSNREMQMNLDGEPIHDSNFRVHMLPRRLSFLLPTQAPLAGTSAK
jgi:diacylglycerol kinase family enzyme